MNNYTKLIMPFIVATFVLFGCINNSDKTKVVQNEVELESSCPTTTIYLQPLGNYTQKEAIKLKEDIEKHQCAFGPVSIKDVIVLPSKPLTESLMNDTKTRYRADKIINELKKDLKTKSTIIGLTHKDVSVSYKGKKDWGVIGLAFRGSNACVISTFRMRNKSEFWKAAAHEFCHAFYGVGHCPKDDSHCILQDAKGKYTFGRSPNLCDYCQSQL